MTDFQAPDPYIWRQIDNLPTLPDATTGMQWNAIVDFWIDPCDAPLHVYAQTALPFLGAAALVLVTPDFREILQTYVEPGGYTGCSRNRRAARARRTDTLWQRTGGRLRLGIPDVDGFIAARLPGRSWFEGRKHSLPERMSWMIFNQFERVAFGIFLVDLTGRAIYAWHSALMETEFCKERELQAAKCYDTYWTIGVQQRPQIVPQVGPKSARNGGEAGINGITMTVQNWRLLMYATITCAGTEPCAGTIYFHGPGGEVFREAPIALPPGVSVDYSSTQTFNGNGQAYMSVLMTEGAASISQNMIWGRELMNPPRT